MICNAPTTSGKPCRKEVVWANRCHQHQNFKNAVMLADNPRPRCQAIGDNGKRCRNMSVRSVKYLGDPAEYGPLITSDPEPMSVIVRLCWMHSVPNGRKNG